MILDKKQLDNIGVNYVDALRMDCIPPVPFYPSDELHFRSQRFLVKEGIRGLFSYDDHVVCANKLVDLPRAKELIETSLLCNSLPAWISTVLKRRGFASTVQAVDAFKHYFFNVDLVDSVEMRTLLRKGGLQFMMMTYIRELSER